jgi:hypothetical protein
MYNQENKICSFNVNEYHLVTILMPYIYEAINQEKKVITFFEKDLKEIYEKVLNTNSLFWRNKTKFDEIDWGKLQINKLSLKFKNAESGSIAIVAGSNKFVEKINKLISNFHTNFTIVNCFEIKEFEKSLDFNLSEYSKLLNTMGIQELKEENLV